MPASSVPGPTWIGGSVGLEWAGMFTLVHPDVRLSYPVRVLKCTPIERYPYGILYVGPFVEEKKGVTHDDFPGSRAGGNIVLDGSIRAHACP